MESIQCLLQADVVVLRTDSVASTQMATELRKLMADLDVKISAARESLAEVTQRVDDILARKMSDEIVLTTHRPPSAMSGQPSLETLTSPPESLPARGASREMSLRSATSTLQPGLRSLPGWPLRPSTRSTDSSIWDVLPRQPPATLARRSRGGSQINVWRVGTAEENSGKAIVPISTVTEISEDIVLVAMARRHRSRQQLHGLRL